MTSSPQYMPDMQYFEMPEMAEESNRVKMCYAFLASPHFFHQEITIINPNPRHFDNRYILPRDIYLLAYHVESGEKMPQLQDVIDMAHKAQTACICIGSHKPDIDRTMQVFCLPKSMDPENTIPDRMLLIVQFLAKLSAAEKNEICEKLRSAYDSLGTASRNP